MSDQKLGYQITKDEQLLDEFFDIRKYTIDIDAFDGPKYQNVIRYSIEKRPATAIVVYHKTWDALVFVKQFRASARQEQDPWLVELVAGVCEQGETAEQTAIREMEEEIGYRLDHLAHVHTMYPTPGICNEKIDLFYGEITEADKVNEGGGTDSDEDLKTIIIPVKDLPSKLKNNYFVDAKTLTGIYWFLWRE